MTDSVKKLARVREVEDDQWVFRYENGLVVHTDPFMKQDTHRVLPVGGPQDAILSRLVAHQDGVMGKSVFDPFAGSGVLGLMALRLGAAHVDFLDISPRAQTFQIDNARRNGFATSRYRALLQSIADFEPAEPYDLVLANPPFVPTPAGLAGTKTSNGGPEGSDLVLLLLARLDGLLRAEGEAFVYVMQLVAEGRPLIASALEQHLTSRHTELTPAQAEAMPFADFAAAYTHWFPSQQREIDAWASALTQRHGASLALQHYVMHVQPQGSGPASCTVAKNMLAKYGQVPYPASSNRDLALARAMENVLPSA